MSGLTLQIGYQTIPRAIDSSPHRTCWIYFHLIISGLDKIERKIKERVKLDISFRVLECLFLFQHRDTFC